MIGKTVCFNNRCLSICDSTISEIAKTVNAKNRRISSGGSCVRGMTALNVQKRQAEKVAQYQEVNGRLGGM